MSKPETITIDDVKYVRADSVKDEIKGNRAVVVVDRGWIFAGDVVRENGQIKLSRALHIRKWDGIGFDGMLKSPLSSNVTLKNVDDVSIPEQSEIFCVPVHENWGLK